MLRRNSPILRSWTILSALLSLSPLLLQIMHLQPASAEFAEPLLALLNRLRNAGCCARGETCYYDSGCPSGATFCACDCTSLLPGRNAECCCAQRRVRRRLGDATSLVEEEDETEQELQANGGANTPYQVDTDESEESEWIVLESYEWQSIASHCANVVYDTYLYVDTHVFGVGVPRATVSNKNNDAKEQHCPPVVMHAVFREEVDGNALVTPTATKQVMIPAQVLVNFNDIGMDEDVGDADIVVRDNLDNLQPSNANTAMQTSLRNALPVGSFALSKIAQAHAATDPNRHSDLTGILDRFVPTGVYDLVHNNCGDWMINLAQHLGVKVDGDVTSYVARRLLQNSRGGNLANKLRDLWQQGLFFTTSSWSLFGNDEGEGEGSISNAVTMLSQDHRRLMMEQQQPPPDQEMVESLVETRTARLYTATTANNNDAQEKA